MRNPRTRAIAIVGLLCLTLVLTACDTGYGTSQGARPGAGSGNGGNGIGDGTNPPAISATPEMDSIVLFGTGAAGIAGYMLLRLRAGRRQDKNPD